MGTGRSILCCEHLLSLGVQTVFHGRGRANEGLKWRNSHGSFPCSLLQKKVSLRYISLCVRSQISRQGRAYLESARHNNEPAPLQQITKIFLFFHKRNFWAHHNVCDHHYHLLNIYAALVNILSTLYILAQLIFPLTFWSYSEIWLNHMSQILYLVCLEVCSTLFWMSPYTPCFGVFFCFSTQECLLTVYLVLLKVECRVVDIPGECRLCFTWGGIGAQVMASL